MLVCQAKKKRTKSYEILGGLYILVQVALHLQHEAAAVLQQVVSGPTDGVRGKYEV